MAIPVLVILAVLWAAFFLWPLLQGRTSGRRVDSIGDFSYRLGVIGKTGGHHAWRRTKAVSPIPLGVPSARALAAASGPVRPSGPTRAQRRRRDVLIVLGAAVLSTLVLAAVAGNPLLWVLQALSDLLMAAYVALLVRMRQLAQEQRVKVRYLPQPSPAPMASPVSSPAPAPVPALVLRRTVSS